MIYVRIFAQCKKVGSKYGASCSNTSCLANIDNQFWKNVWKIVQIRFSVKLVSASDCMQELGERSLGGQHWGIPDLTQMLPMEPLWGNCASQWRSKERERETIKPCRSGEKSTATEPSGEWDQQSNYYVRIVFLQTFIQDIFVLYLLFLERNIFLFYKGSTVCKL